MKNFILLFCFMMFAGMAMGQMKMFSSGKATFGDTGVNASSEITIATASTPSLFIRNTSTGPAEFKFGNMNQNYRFFLGGNNSFIIRDLTGGSNVFTITPGATKQSFVASNNGSVGIGRSPSASTKLDVGGDIGINGVVMVSSDKRLKKNVKNFVGGLEEVMKMNVINFEYNGKAGTPENSKYLGVYAQDLAKIAPYLVQEFEYHQTDDMGNTISTENYLQINDTGIKYLLVNAIKEQQQIIEGLQDQITEITTLVSSLSKNEDSNIQTDLSDVAINELKQNLPNPYTDQTVIEYTVSSNSKSASMKFYNLSGQLIKSIDLQIGKGKITLTTDELPSGTYTYALEVDGRMVSNKKMVKMR